MPVRNTTVAKFRKWWPDNKVKILEDCGEVGAAQVYSYYTGLGKKKSK